MFCSHKCHIPLNLWPRSSFTLLCVGCHGCVSASHTYISKTEWVSFLFQFGLSFLFSFLLSPVGRIKETFSVWRGAWNFLCDLPGTQQNTRLLRPLFMCVLSHVLVLEIRAIVKAFSSFKRDWMSSTRSRLHIKCLIKVDCLIPLVFLTHRGSLLNSNFRPDK